MRSLCLILVALCLSGCQLLTNFVRPLVDDPDAPDAYDTDAYDTDAAVEDAGELDAGSPLDAP
jgi:hypothetical protein